MLISESFKKHYVKAHPTHCFAKHMPRNTMRKYHNAMTTDRFTKRPKTEHTNMSLDHWQIPTPTKTRNKMVFFKALSRTTREAPMTPWNLNGTPPEPPRHLCTPIWRPPWGPPKTVWVLQCFTICSKSAVADLHAAHLDVCIHIYTHVYILGSNARSAHAEAYGIIFSDYIMGLHYGYRNAV